MALARRSSWVVMATGGGPGAPTDAACDTWGFGYPVAPMSREQTFLLALGLLIAAAGIVSAAGWTLFVRDRRAARPSHHPEAAEER